MTKNFLTTTPQRLSSEASAAWPAVARWTHRCVTTASPGVKFSSCVVGPRSVSSALALPPAAVRAKPVRRARRPVDGLGVTARARCSACAAGTLAESTRIRPILRSAHRLARQRHHASGRGTAGCSVRPIIFVATSCAKLHPAFRAPRPQMASSTRDKLEVDGAPLASIAGSRTAPARRPRASPADDPPARLFPLLRVTTSQVPDFRNGRGPTSARSACLRIANLLSSSADRDQELAMPESNPRAKPIWIRKEEPCASKDEPLALQRTSIAHLRTSLSLAALQAALLSASCAVSSFTGKE